MAKKTHLKVRMVPESNPDSKFIYYAKKPTKGEKAKDKLKLKKYNPNTRKHEYFIEKNWQLGRLTYKGQTFEVNMLYNTFHDLLLIQNATNSSTKMEPLKLAQYFISDFEIGDKIFKRLDGIEAPESPGFYRVLFETPEIKIFVRRAKKKLSALRLREIQGLLII